MVTSELVTKAADFVEELKKLNDESFQATSSGKVPRTVHTFVVMALQAAYCARISLEEAYALTEEGVLDAPVDRGHQENVEKVPG